MAIPSEVLTALKQSIGGHRDGAHVGPKIKEKLSQVDEELARLIETLKTIEDSINLDTAASEPAVPASAMDLWKRLTAGMHRQSAEVTGIVRSSVLLNSLYKKGIDFKKFYKFSDKETQLAQRLGDRYSDYSAGLSALRRSKEGKTKTEKQMLLTGTAKNAEFIKFMTANRIAEIGKMLVKKGSAWVPFKTDWFKADNDEVQVLVVFTPGDPDAYRFLHGEWLNAYVYNIIQDHFTRNDVAFELFTNVSYQAPQDIIRVAGEFDVIGSVRNQLICVECKSGKLLNQKNTIEDIVKKITDLKRAVYSMSSREAVEFVFYLVFDPTLNDETEVNNRLKESDLKALRPDQVRPEVMNRFAA